MVNYRKEAELYEPIKDYFLSHDYFVNGEVNSVDMVISKDDEYIGIELKSSFNLKLLLQAVDRQKYFDSVYVAIEKPNKKNKRYREIIHLLKRLEIGLITVTFLKKGPVVTIEHHPLEFKRAKNNKKKKMIIREVEGRTGVLDNVGGTTKIKRITVYRETALHICYALSLLDTAAPKEIKKMTENDKTGQILYQNHYGWYERVDKGVYKISNKGLKALKEYSEIIDHFKVIVERKLNETT